MGNISQHSGADASTDKGVLGATINSAGKQGIDPKVLAQTDLGLFRSLRKIGASRERICSALFLSYAEYEDILKIMEGAR